MLSAGYFHPFLSRVAASVVGIDNDREGQRSGYQLPPVAGKISIKIGSILREQKFFTSSKLLRLLLTSGERSLILTDSLSSVKAMLSRKMSHRNHPLAYECKQMCSDLLWNEVEVEIM
jgi:hypothetical protein